MVLHQISIALEIFNSSSRRSLTDSDSYDNEVRRCGWWLIWVPKAKISILAKVRDSWQKSETQGKSLFLARAELS